MLLFVLCSGCESWTINKAEHQRIDAFELWYWRRLLRVPWTARRSNQSVQKEINPKYSLEGLLLKLQYFGHLIQRADTSENKMLEDREAWCAAVHKVTKSWTRLSNWTELNWMNIEDWFPLGLTGLISLQNKGFSRVFSNITVQSISSSAFSLLYGLTLISIHDYWKNHSFECSDLCRQSNVSTF